MGGRLHELQQTAGNSAVVHLVQNLRSSGRTIRSGDYGTTGGPYRTGSPKPDNLRSAGSLVGSLHSRIVDSPFSSDASGDAALRPIQRAPTTARDPTLAPSVDSAPGLVEIYEGLMASDVFQNLARKARAHGQIRLAYSPDMLPARYDSLHHTVELPRADPPEKLRDLMFFEMHNATAGAWHRNLMDDFGQAHASLTAGGRLYDTHVNVAAYALAVEWSEWMKTAENYFRTRQADADLGGNRISNYFGSGFDKADEGWFRFDKYLAVQLPNGHTAHYDPAATTPYWVGFGLMEKAQSVAPRALMISRDELAKFLENINGDLKDVTANPFTQPGLSRLASDTSTVGASA
jgi:hypothetical protein